MSEIQDRWAQWVLDKGHGGTVAGRATKLAYLEPVRARVLENAAVHEGNELLDVGTGDGLIGLGALDLVGMTGRVILSDISEDLVGDCRRLAAELDVLDRTDFLVASADDLREIGDASVDAVTTRSVLIYLPFAAKRIAFQEFHRVLRPGGRLSIFEPINRYFSLLRTEEFWGYDVRPVKDLMERVVAAYGNEDSTLVDFGEDDLLTFAQEAGFAEVHLELTVNIVPEPWFDSWESFMSSSGNPLIPTQREAIERALSREEAARLAAHLRPLVERGEGIKRQAAAYLWAAK